MIKGPTVEADVEKAEFSLDFRSSGKSYNVAETFLVIANERAPHLYILPSSAVFLS